MATIHDIEGAMNSLRAEISSIVAPQIAASVTALRNEVGGSVTAALAELRQHSANTAQQVSDTVQTQFQQAATGFSDEQAQMRAQLQAGQDRITAESLRVTTTQTVIEETLKTLQSNLDGAVAKLASVSDGKLEGIAEKLKDQDDQMTTWKVTLSDYEAEQKKYVEVVHTIMSKEVRDMHGSVTQLSTAMGHRMAQVEHIVEQQVMNAPVDGGRQGQGEHEDTKSAFPIQRRGT